MCQIKSAIVLKNKVYMPFNHDHHTKMLEELNIKDENEFPNFVRIEISPIDDNIFNHDLNNWKMKVDQDYRPDWFDFEKYEKEVKLKLNKWFTECFIIDKEVEEIKDKFIYAIKNSKVKNICDSAQVKNICDSAQVKNICDSAQVKNICDSAQVKNIYGSAQVKNICDSAQVENICDSAQVKNIYGSAQVKNIYGSAQVENICGSAQVKNICDSAQVKNICGSAQVENICGSAQVKNIYGSAQVKNIYGSAQIKIPDYASNPKILNVKGLAIIKDMRIKEIIVASDKYKLIKRNKL